MSERCKWVSRSEPRILPDRHQDDCQRDSCGGCLPCPMDHCRVCGVGHATGACPECVGAVRDDLAEILRMCADLPAEVRFRGIDGEAMNLLGPVANPEARGYWTASVLAGRITPVDCDAHELADVKAWLETANHDRHPLLVIGTWAMTYRDAFEHDEPTSRVTIADDGGYLGRNLTHIAAFEHVPFEDFARDLRQCVAHMERVLHDGEQVDEGAPCLTCNARLERTWGRTLDEDGWRCPRCRTTSNDAQYRFAVKADFIANAEWLTAEDMQTRTHVLAATVRSWAREQPEQAPPLVRKTLHSERTVYSVTDVERVRDAKGLAPCA